MGLLPQLQRRHPNIAFLYALIGNTSLASMQILFKFLSQLISPLLLLFIRAIVLICINSLILATTGREAHLNRRTIFKLTLVRLLCTSTGSALLHYSFKELPLSTASTLFNLNPIFVLFLENIYYKKSMNKLALLITVVCFAGVLLIVQPQFLFGSGAVGSLIPHFTLLSCMVIASAFLVACAFIVIHDTAKQIDSFVNLHYTYMGHILVTGVSGQFHQFHFGYQQMTWAYWAMLLGFVCFGWAAQAFVYEASRMKKPSIVMPFCYIAIMFSFAADVYLFGIDFGALQVLGMVLTSSGLLSKFLIEKYETAGRKEENS